MQGSRCGPIWCPNQHLLEGLRQTTKKPQPGQKVFGPRYESKVSEMWSRSDTIWLQCYIRIHTSNILRKCEDKGKNTHPYAQACYEYIQRQTHRDLHTLDVATRPRGVFSLTNCFIPRKTLCHLLQRIMNKLHSHFKINTKRKYPTFTRTQTPVIPTKSLWPYWVNCCRSIIFVYTIIQPNIMRKKVECFRIPMKILFPKPHVPVHIHSIPQWL